MARPFVLEIVESQEFLEKSLKHAKTAARKERLQMSLPIVPRVRPATNDCSASSDTLPSTAMKLLGWW
jgi:hypothetical protein